MTHKQHIAAQHQGPGPQGPGQNDVNSKDAGQDGPGQDGCSPDTEVSPPLAAGSATGALDGDAIASETRALSTVPAANTSGDPADQRHTHQGASAQDLKTTQKSQLAPSRSVGSAAPEQEASRDPVGSNTTLHSMRKPELVPGAVPHSRRFLSIEHELVELNLALRVLEKQTEKAERRLFFALLTAAGAVLLAALGLAK